MRGDWLCVELRRWNLRFTILTRDVQRDTGRYVKLPVEVGVFLSAMVVDVPQSLWIVSLSSSSGKSANLQSLALQNCVAAEVCLCLHLLTAQEGELHMAGSVPLFGVAISRRQHRKSQARG